MSSTKDKIRDWFFALPEEQRNQIDGLIEEIREREGFIETHEQSLRETVRKLARILEALIDDPSQTSIIIKAIANGRISDDTIEKALPEEKKRKHKPYETYRQLEQNRKSVFQDPETVTVSNSGSQSITDPEGKEREEEVEEEYQYYGPRMADTNIHDENAEKSAEIALANNQQLVKEKQDLKIRLNEAFVLIEDKDRELDRIRLAMGELELQIRDLKKNPPTEKDIDEKEELQIKYDELKIAYEELKAVESLRVKQQDFKPASKIQSPPKVWVAAINALNLYRGLNEASKYAIEHNDPWKKVLFDVADNGQLKNARLEQVA